MLGQFGVEDEDALLDELARRRLADAQAEMAGTVGPEATPETPDIPVAMPERRRMPLHPAPAPAAEVVAAPVADTGLEDARAADADAAFRRGLELASRQAIAGIGLQRAPTSADLVTQPGQAEAVFRKERAQAKDSQEAARKADLEARRVALLELAAETDPDLKRLRAETEKRRAEAYAKSVDAQEKIGLERVQDSKNRTAAIIERTRQKGLGGGKKKADEGKMLPASEVSGLSELPVAEAQVDALADTFTRLNMGGMSGRASGAATDVLGLRFTDAAEYNAAAKLAMQAAGKIMEGGKLAAGDEAKYAALLPRPGDSDAVVQQKVAGMKSFLRDLAGRRASAFKDAGYNVPASLMPKAEQQASKPASGFIRMVGPDGDVAMVEPGDVEEFKRNGYK